jgi:hypothetical protein
MAGICWVRGEATPSGRWTERAFVSNYREAKHADNAWFTIGAALAALPTGYCAGLLAAVALAGGPNFGQAPLLTVPLGLLAALAFALVPILPARTRFTSMAVAAIVSVLLFVAVRPTT